jgi:hypothetical protein
MRIQQQILQISISLFGELIINAIKKEQLTMNNYILKMITLYILLSLSLCATSLSHKEISKMVSKIKKERTGIDLSTLDKTPNPFPIMEKIAEKEIQVEKKAEVLKKIVVNHQLTAILNHRAFIDGKWYKVGERVGAYKLIHIDKDKVILKGQKERRELVIPQREKKFKIFKGG